MYLMAYFRTGAEALHLALSEDALRWRAINGNKPILEGSVGSRTLRDPFLFLAQDDTFHLVCTDGWQSDCIVHCSSPDLRRWSQQALLPVMQGVSGVRNAWAPECRYDNALGEYRIFWSSTVAAPEDSDPGHRIWCATTSNFLECSPPQLLFDPGYNVIDATIERNTIGYLMAFKDERGMNQPGSDWKAIRTCHAPNVGGPWSAISELITPTFTEGPVLLRQQDCWILIFDHFVEGKFGAMRSHDAREWLSITEQASFPLDARHASVVEISHDVGVELERAFSS